MNNQVAQTIYQQLGAGRFAVMTGAKQFVASEKSLTFKLPGGAFSKQIKCISITLDPSDTYTVKTYTAKGVRTCIAERTLTGVYCDSLQRLITELTGLATHL